MTALFGIAGVQMSVVPWNPAATIDKMAQVVNRIGRSFPWVQMVIFHELCPSGLVQFDALPDWDTWQSILQPIPGPLTDRLCEIAAREKRWLIPGSLYERAGDKTYNTALAISPEGAIVARYRKIFPWYPYEAEVTPGDEFSVFDIPGAGCFGLAICYDMWFPEHIRTLVWKGAEVIIHPTMTPTSDREMEIVLSQANAITNQCYFVDINGVGPWGGGRSLIADPDGRVIQKAGDNETIMTEILDLDRVRITREYGNQGLSQLLKQMRDSNVQFPPYGPGFPDGQVFRNLGELTYHRHLTLANNAEATAKAGSNRGIAADK